MRTLRRYTKLLFRLGKIYFSRQANKTAEYRRVIFYTLKDWGGVYIKFLQVMAGTSKFMEGWGGPQELQVFAQVPYEPIDLSQELDLTKFSTISSAPVAAGSFALVYRGTLTTGEDVAIKILRPSIRQHLQHDLAVLRRFCHFLSRFLPRLLVDCNEAYEACVRMFTLETDYAREIANQTYFAELYRKNPNVVIPKVYTELSSQFVIVQEYMNGPTLADVMSQITPDKSARELTFELTGSDLWQQVVIAGGEALYTAMCADYVYGDPHPGNIILLPDNRIALIDFGIIADKPSSHLAFYKWVESYFRILNGEEKFVDLLENTVTCFAPDLSIAMRRCNFDGGDLLSVLATAMTEKLNNEMNGESSYIESFKEGHILDVFLHVVNTQVIEVKVDMVNFELL